MLQTMRQLVRRKSNRCDCFLILWDELRPRRNAGVVKSTILFVPQKTGSYTRPANEQPNDEEADNEEADNEEA